METCTSSTLEAVCVLVNVIGELKRWIMQLGGWAGAGYCDVSTHNLASKPFYRYSILGGVNSFTNFC